MRAMCLLVLATLASLEGCGNLNSVYRNFNVDDGTGAMVDIKQRAVIASRQVSGAGPTAISRTIVCSEPSPDALSAYAAELAAEANIPGEVTARLAAASQESASFIGLRTQSIQLLRDSLYRLCEGYMSGALKSADYDILMRRYQKYMVALLGIEQLTGTIRAPAVTINTQGGAEASRSIGEMRSEIEAIDERIKTLEEMKKKDDVEEDEKTNIEKNVKELKQDKRAIANAIRETRGLVASGSATATVNNFGLPTQRSDQHITNVSKAVERIVLNIVNTDDTGQLCWRYLVDSKREETTLDKVCLDYVANINVQNALKNQARTLQLRQEEAMLQEILEGTTLDSDQSSKLDQLKELMKTSKEIEETDQDWSISITDNEHTPQPPIQKLPEDMLKESDRQPS